MQLNCCNTAKSERKWRRAFGYARDKWAQESQPSLKIWNFWFYLYETSEKKDRAFGRINWWILSPVCVSYQTDMKIVMYCTAILILLADLTLIPTYGMYIIFFSACSSVLNFFLQFCFLVFFVLFFLFFSGEGWGVVRGFFTQMVSMSFHIDLQ